MSTLRSVAKFAFVAAPTGLLLQESLFDVDGGHRVVIFDRFRGGVQDHVYGEGTHFRIPWVQQVFDFDVRTRHSNISTKTGTKDLQTVNISLRVLSRPDPDKVNVIYKELGMNYDFRVLPSIGPEVLKSIVAQYNAAELLQKRDKVSNDIQDQLKERARDFNIWIDDVSITHLTYRDDFTAAIEAKQVAQQEAERQKFIVAKAEQERIAAITLAEGESESAMIFSDAVAQHGTAIIELRRIEAAKHIAGTLARSRNITYLPSGNNMLLNLPA